MVRNRTKSEEKSTYIANTPAPPSTATGANGPSSTMLAAAPAMNAPVCAPSSAAPLPSSDISFFFKGKKEFDEKRLR